MLIALIFQWNTPDFYSWNRLFHSWLQQHSDDHYTLGLQLQLFLTDMAVTHDIHSAISQAEVFVGFLDLNCTNFSQFGSGRLGMDFSDTLDGFGDNF